MEPEEKTQVKKFGRCVETIKDYLKEAWTIRPDGYYDSNDGKYHRRSMLEALNIQSLKDFGPSE
jgi:hypothetical protein